MSNPFERFGITHLSPSSLNLYCANPTLWVGRYLYGWKDESGPSAYRGQAVEAGLDVFLFERKDKEAFERAQAKFDELCGGVLDDEHEEERLNIAGMLRQAITALKDYPIPIGRQFKVEYHIEDIEVPVMGYIDYLFDDFGLDLKTTKACPSSLKADHARQVALYSKVRQRPFRVLYATPKKFAVIPLTDNEATLHIGDLERHARAVRHLLSHSKSPKEAAQFFALNRDDFRWSERTLALATA